MPPDFIDAYDEYLPRVYAFLAYRTSSREDAEDLTQATFERALRSWHRYDPRRASLATWLIAIARNLLIDSSRASAVRPTTSPLDEHDEPRDRRWNPEADSEHDVIAALRVLTPRDREIVALRFGADMTGPEIAELTGLSLANVQQILSRGLRRLREELEGR